MSKSRNEKKPAAQQAPVLTSNDIIPGKFNEHQWNCMVEQETAQEFVLDIVDEIVDCTIKVIYDKYIQSQLQPYSVEAAKDLLLQIIESRFLGHDSGEEFPENDMTWLEDEEPTACVTDSWSQGSVPVQKCLSRPLSARSDSGSYSMSLPGMESHHHVAREDESKDEHTAPDDVEKVEEQGNIATESSSQKLPQETDVSVDAEIVPSPPLTGRCSASSRRKPAGKTTGRRRKQPSRVKPCPEDDTPDVNKNTQAGTSGLSQLKTSNQVQKTRNGRGVGQPEVTYDEQGNIIAMARFSADKLPHHRIRTRYNIIDPHSDPLALASQQTRRMTVKASVLSQSKENQGASTINMKIRHEKQTFVSPVFKSSYSETANKDEEAVKPLPPPLVDSMNLSAGVVIREGDVMRKGPAMHMGSTLREKTKQDILNLQPVGSLSKKQSISVSDVIGTTSPVIKQMRLPDPIPPIASYQRS